MGFEFKTPPFPHQLEEWERSRSMPTRAIFWEQGTGKTKLTLDTAAWLYLDGKIDGMLVVAPNGVHQNWTTDEIPAHMPPGVPVHSFAYSTKRAKTKTHQAALREVLEAPGLAFLAISYDAFMTDSGREAALAFLGRRRTLFVCDESQRIKSAAAKRTRAVVYAGRRATFKRILSGTPVTNKPFDVYPQVKFLNENFWKDHGFASYEAFKTHFGIWEQRENGSTGQRFMQVVAFRDIENLAKMVGEVSSRVTKEQALTLPPKLYSKFRFEMTPEQAKMYEDIRDEFAVFLDSGETITAPLVVTRLLRLQQVACGYYAVDDPEGAAPELRRFPENPRIKALLEVLEDHDDSAIIFARFREDIDQIMAALPPGEAVRYDGAVDEDGRLEARQGFQAGKVRYFVANPAAAATGLTLHRANLVVYYSNSFNLEHRLQSEDRAHRIGQARDLRIVDLIAIGTIDSKIVSALRNKLNIASKITGDAAKEWL